MDAVLRAEEAVHAPSHEIGCLVVDVEATDGTHLAELSREPYTRVQGKRGLNLKTRRGQLPP